MKTFANWVLNRRYWLILLAVSFVQVFPLVAAALLVMETRARGPAQAFGLAVLGLVAIAILSLFVGVSLSLALAIGAATLFSGVAMGSLLQTGGLGLAFQGTVLGGLALVALVTLAGPDAATMVGPLINQLVEFMRAGGEATEQDLELIRNFDPAVLIVVLFAGLFLQLLVALMLGYWWYSLAREDGQFGAEFRALKLGRTVGILLMVIATLSFVAVPLTQNLRGLAVIGFCFQGLAVMHAWAYTKKWHPAGVGAIYVACLIPPLSALSILGLSITGLLDNFFALRAPLRGQA